MLGSMRSSSSVVEEHPINQASILSPVGPHTPVGTECTKEGVRVADSLAGTSSPALPVPVSTRSLAKRFASHFFDSVLRANSPPATSFLTVCNLLRCSTH